MTAREIFSRLVPGLCFLVLIGALQLVFWRGTQPLERPAAVHNPPPISHNEPPRVHAPERFAAPQLENEVTTSLPAGRSGDIDPLNSVGHLQLPTDPTPATPLRTFGIDEIRPQSPRPPTKSQPKTKPKAVAVEVAPPLAPEEKPRDWTDAPGPRWPTFAVRNRLDAIDWRAAAFKVGQ